MTPNDAMLRYSQFLNRLVIEYESTEEVGYVDTLLVDVKRSQVTGLVCKAGLLGRDRRQFTWAQIENIGKDSIVVHHEVEVSPDRLAAAQNVIGLEVWTDTGNKAGQIADYEINCATGQVLRYLFANGVRELTEGLYGLLPEAILSAGRKRMMVTANAIEQAELCTVGLNQQVNQATDFLKSDYDQTRQDWQGLMKGAQSLAEQWQQRTQKLKNYTQEHLPELPEQLQTKTQEMRNQVQKKVADVRDRLQGSQPKQPFIPDNADPETIDIESFEVWEEE